MAAGENDPIRKAELLKIAEVCRWVPAHAPRNFWEAVQMYWFAHLGIITELNGWDAIAGAAAAVASPLKSMAFKSCFTLAWPCVFCMVILPVSVDDSISCHVAACNRPKACQT